jgi:hypothetical protein
VRKFFEKIGTLQIWHLYLIKKFIFIYENNISQIDSISLVDAMLHHIKNSFDHFSDEFIFEKKLSQAVQIWHLYFEKYIDM